MTHIPGHIDTIPLDEVVVTAQLNEEDNIELANLTQGWIEEELNEAEIARNIRNFIDTHKQKPEEVKEEEKEEEVVDDSSVIEEGVQTNLSDDPLVTEEQEEEIIETPGGEEDVIVDQEEL